VGGVKNTGMTRKVDDLGRIVLPVELRRLHSINTGDALEISVHDGAIVLRKLEQGCVFCDGSDGLSAFKDRQICTACVDALGRRDEPAPMAEAHAPSY
jgi:AbrB family transcriptional regulator, transcriptional pleiotropic regulator of transition state genes